MNFIFFICIIVFVGYCCYQVVDYVDQCFTVLMKNQHRLEQLIKDWKDK